MEKSPMQADQKLAEIVRRLVDAYQPLHIYLFGSRARGDFGPDSDIDILVDFDPIGESLLMSIKPDTSVPELT